MRAYQNVDLSKGERRLRDGRHVAAADVPASERSEHWQIQFAYPEAMPPVLLSGDAIAVAQAAITEAKRKAEEEEKRKADEDARRKAEEEEKRKADAEAKRKAEELPAGPELPTSERKQLPPRPQFGPVPEPSAGDSESLPPIAGLSRWPAWKVVVSGTIGVVVVGIGVLAVDKISGEPALPDTVESTELPTEPEESGSDTVGDEPTTASSDGVAVDQPPLDNDEPSDGKHQTPSPAKDGRQKSRPPLVEPSPSPGSSSAASPRVSTGVDTSRPGRGAPCTPARGCEGSLNCEEQFDEVRGKMGGRQIWTTGQRGAFAAANLRLTAGDCPAGTRRVGEPVGDGSSSTICQGSWASQSAEDCRVNIHAQHGLGRWHCNIHIKWQHITRTSAGHLCVE